MDVRPFSENITTEGETEVFPEANQSQIKPFSEGIQGNIIDGIPGSRWENDSNNIADLDDNKYTEEGFDKVEKVKIINDYCIAAGITSYEHKQFIHDRVNSEWKDVAHRKNFGTEFMDFLKSADTDYQLSKERKEIPKLRSDEKRILTIFYNTKNISETELSRKLYIEKEIKEEWGKRKIPEKETPTERRSAFLTLIQEFDAMYMGTPRKEIDLDLGVTPKIPKTKEEEIEEEIAFLVKDKVPKMTLEEKKSGWNRKGVVPQWWPKTLSEDTVPYWLARGIKAYNVSAAEIEKATREASEGKLNLSEEHISIIEDSLKEKLIGELKDKGLSQIAQLLQIKVSYKKQNKAIADIKYKQRLLRVTYPPQMAEKLIKGKEKMPRPRFFNKGFAEKNITGEYYHKDVGWY